MPTYRTNASGASSPTQNLVIVSVTVFRDDEGVANFEARFPATMNDSDILVEIDRRVQNFVDVDANRIAKDQLDERATTIAGSLEDKEYTPSP